MNKQIDLTVVIPNRNSQFTTQTINDVLKNAGCEVEVIVNVDENWPEPLVEDERVHYIHPPQPIGLRAGINNCVRMAKGKYIMKTDDHCASGFIIVILKSSLVACQVFSSFKLPIIASSSSFARSGDNRKDSNNI